MESWVPVIIAFCIIFPLILLAAVHNLLARRKILVQDAWQVIDALLTRRANLIAGLVEMSKPNLAADRDALEAVTRGRTAGFQAASVAEQGRVAGQLGAALDRLIAAAETHPDLKGSEDFMALQASLGEVEDEIQLARRHYNGTVRDFNNLIDTFPSNLIAKAFGYMRAEFFELEDPAAANAPRPEP